MDVVILFSGQKSGQKSGLLTGNSPLRGEGSPMESEEELSEDKEGVLIGAGSYPGSPSLGASSQYSPSRSWSEIFSRVFGQADIACRTVLDSYNFFSKPAYSVACPPMAQCYDEEDDGAEQNVEGDQAD